MRPQLVLYNAGVDVHADDALGKMALTDAGEHAKVVDPWTEIGPISPYPRDAMLRMINDVQLIDAQRWICRLVISWPTRQG